MLAQREFWANLASASIVAACATVPILTSSAIDRGVEISKLSAAAPLAVLAFGAAALAGGFSGMVRLGASMRIAVGALAAFLLLALTSAVLSESFGVAFFGSYYRREGLLAWGAYGAFFFAVLGWARSRERVMDVLDALLLASVIPIVYGLQLRLNLSYGAFVGGDVARPGSTLGNPVFLAAYLALLLPITIVRCWQTRRRRRELALWAIVATLQASALLVTQTRGPLLALVAGLLMLACLAAAFIRARWVLIYAGAVFSVAVLFLVAINTVPALTRLVQDTPVVGRMVFSLDPAAARTAHRASRSAAARLGLWDAGARTFSAAPLSQQLLGYGPESAHANYSAYLPALVMQVDGYGAEKTYDRLHADTLDIALNFGVLGWLAYCAFFAAVLYAAARAMFGLSGRGPPALFCVLMLVGGVSSAIAATGAGLASAQAPAFGLGVGAGWFAFLAGCAWRAASRKVLPGVKAASGEWLLLAGLTSALLVFWFDAQVNIPVLTTRLVSFGFAALILVTAHGLMRATDGSESDSAARGAIRAWAIAFSVTAACASFLPAAIYASSAGPAYDPRWALRMLPIVAFLPFALWSGWIYRAAANVDRRGMRRRWMLIAAATPVLYAAAHFALMVRAGPDLRFAHLDLVSMATFAGPLFIVAAALAFARVATPKADAARVCAGRTTGRRYAPIMLAAAVLPVVFAGWIAIRADVASAVALRVSAGQPALSEQWAREAIRLMPHERFYQRQLVFDLLGRAVADLRRLGTDRERYAAAERGLAAAEVQARALLRRFPGDAWSSVALANVLQVRGLRILRAYTASAGEEAAMAANTLFAQANRMFPAQPLVLRNWAQLRFDQGDAPGAYELLDRMETLIPAEPDAYAERIAFASQVSDSAAIDLAIARARSRLTAEKMRRLLRVANAQHK